ncbi:MFS transporter [Pelistega ratti]|uniref:MFS transporter n=1 Tax=Pelistega ratti TaxID=2652177 RepID=UPI00135B0586|nr:MFS transporter [Pelistega ratti]
MIKKFASFNHDVKLTLITTLLSNIGIFMVIPFLSIFLNQLATITTSEVGIIIGVAFWCQRAGSLLGGLLSDYIHTKGTMLLGLIVRIPGYLLIGYVDNFYLLLLSCILIGLGSSIYLPAAKSFLIKVIGENEKVSVLSMRAIFANIGVAIGPIIGVAVFSLSPSVLFTSVGIIFIFLTLLNLKLNGDVNPIETRKISLCDLLALIKNKTMICISIAMFLVMAFFMQIDVTIPMFTSATFDNQTTSYVFICNALIVIFFQSSVSSWACSGSSRLPFSLAFLLFSACFLLFDFITTEYSILFLSIILFSLAEIIIQIRLDYDTTNINPNMVATAFGIMSLAGAFGGLFGSYTGTLLYNTGLFGLSLWTLLALSSAIAAFIYFIYHYETE